MHTCNLSSLLFDKEFQQLFCNLDVSNINSQYQERTSFDCSSSAIKSLLKNSNNISAVYCKLKELIHDIRVKKHTLKIKINYCNHQEMYELSEHLLQEFDDIFIKIKPSNDNELTLYIGSLTDNKERGNTEDINPILKVYPYAKSALDGLDIGDVVLCDINSRGTIITPHNIDNCATKDFFVIAKVNCIVI